MELNDSSTIIGAALIVVGVILYLYTAFCFQRIARNLQVKHPWLAWIPILNVYLWCKICGKGFLWTILFFVPVVNLVIFVMLCVKLARACGRGILYGILFIFPILDLIILWVFVRSSEVQDVQLRVDGD